MSLKLKLKLKLKLIILFPVHLLLSSPSPSQIKVPQKRKIMDFEFGVLSKYSLSALWVLSECSLNTLCVLSELIMVLLVNLSPKDEDCDLLTNLNQTVNIQDFTLYLLAIFLGIFKLHLWMTKRLIMFDFMNNDNDRQT